MLTSFLCFVGASVGRDGVLGYGGFNDEVMGFAKGVG